MGRARVGREGQVRQATSPDHLWATDCYSVLQQFILLVGKEKSASQECYTLPFTDPDRPKRRSTLLSATAARPHHGEEKGTESWVLSTRESFRTPPP